LKLNLSTFLENSQKMFLETAKFSDNSAFVKFGLSDAAKAKDSYLVFSDDRPRSGLLIHSQIDPAV